MNPAGVITVSAVRPNPVYMATGPRSTSPPPIQVEDQLPLPEPVVKPKPLIQQQPQPGKQQNVIILIDRRPSQPFMTTGPMATSVAVPVMTRAPSAGTPVVVMPAAQPAATANPLTIMAPAPVQTQRK
ncbi:hypothetical protein LSH36_397g00000 [Paralvinella palmiformis]|uniref:Uncharacterized protein n=1 Tax=Paralvinella palmiformis TaxID=53620 RepID=A0AAD9JD95_9ANNE|nr:hypothetical protein LSH36_397g00000 [Paralvinella palmiformis]